jgi:predicted DNA binding CopG/RHH family protein
MRSKKYNTLFEFLDDNLKDVKNPSDEFIIDLKKKYWRDYFYHYRKNYRQKLQEVTLRFSNKNIEKINIKRGSLSLPQFLYNCIDVALELNQKSIMDKETLGRINLNLMQIIHLLEEIIDANNDILTQELLERIEELEKQFKLLTT